MIQSLLIANRGEIACRIIRTARAMGIRTVAVYSDADAKALHVRQADEAVHIGPSPARESYLVGEKIIAAARATGAEAIHPGYGFLSENADFAQDVIDAGLIWVGPRPDSIRAMGLKDAAKERMIAAGVPVTPGYLGADQSIERLSAEAEAIGYPVLIKAVAGGGGKGMRKVDSAADFADALLSCQREAASSFGNDQVLLEKWITNPRHIEVQVFGDTHGNVVHLFERDCSLQRRHQKVIEEAPAPGVTEYTRSLICAAAVRAAKAVDYVGAGTIEFIADGSAGHIHPDRVWFMEMNTRLQVEHPVTEEITGVDLVEWQLRVASGEVLPKRQDELSINGWAMEARLYAENPAIGFLPSTGKLDLLTLHAGNGRVETGVQEGDEVSRFYDPMIAKLVSRGDYREDAIDNLGAKLANINIWPVKTNAGFLFRTVTHPEFRQAAIDTSFIERHFDDLIPPEIPSASALQHGQAILRWQDNAYENDPWNGGLLGLRINRTSERHSMICLDGKTVEAPLGDLTDGDFRPDEHLGLALINERGQTYAMSPWRVDGSGSGASSDGAIISPMPGRIIALLVSEGDTVTKGQKLLTLEAMKMEHSLVAPYDGTVADLNASEGGQVSEGAVLARVVAKGE